MRRRAFEVAQPSQAPSARHRARSLNFHDQSVFSYANPGSHWWGYA